MSKITYTLFGHKTIVYRTIMDIDKDGKDLIRKASVGHKSYATRHETLPGFVTIISNNGLTEQHLDISNYIIN